MIVDKTKFGQLIGNLKIAQVGLLGEFVAQAKAVIEDPQDDDQLAGQFGFLAQQQFQFVVLIADIARFPPGLFPGLIYGITPNFSNDEVTAQR